MFIGTFYSSSKSLQVASLRRPLMSDSEGPLFLGLEVGLGRANLSVTIDVLANLQSADRNLLDSPSNQCLK